MPHPDRRRHRYLVLLVAFGMLLGACASGSDDAATTVAATDSAASSSEGEAAAAPSTDDGDSAGDADDTADDDTADDGDDGPTSEDAGDGADDTPMGASSPIGAFFADGGGFEAAIAEYTARVEEQIVRCMAEQGFEFKPSENGRSNPVEDAQNDLTERAWTEEYGFGISTSFDSIASQQATDPNAEIIFSLSAGEREAWLDTLLGVDREGFGVDTGARPLEDQGCIGASIIATGGQDAIEGLEDFGSAYDEAEEAIYDRTEMITAVDAWSQCMSGVGYTGYADLDDPEDEIDDRLSEITAPIGAALDEADEDEMRALVAGDTLELDSLPGLDVEALRELQSDERALALADLDCFDEHVRAIFEPLRDEFEQGLLDTYSDELNALKNIGS